MEVTACFRRISLGMLVVLLGLALSSCAVKRSSSRDVQPLDSGAPTAQAAAQHIDADLRVERLANGGLGQIGLELISGSGFDRLVVDSTAPFELTKLESPARIVLDLNGASGATPRVLPAEGSELISQVRVGAHPDKTRIVLDLKSDQTTAQQADLIDGKVVLSLARAGNMQAALNAPINPERIDTMMAEYSADKEQAAKEIVLATTQTETTPADAFPMLRGLALENVAGLGTTLVADVDRLGIYNLTKTAPSEYVLTLKGTNIEQAANTTILAPPSPNGAPRIRSVRPVVKGSDVLLRIFAAPETVLSASQSGNRLLVSAAGAGGLSEIKGQMAEADADKKEAKNDTAAPAKADGEKAEVSASAAPAEAGSEDFSSLLADAPRYSGRLISLDLQDTDIDNALRIIAEVSNLNIIASDDVTGKVTLRLIDVPWDQALDVILKTNGLDKVQEGNVIRIAPVEKLRLEREALKQAQEAEEELEPLSVKYVRISYAKASELKPLVESVITERGTVAYDERTNQLIIKDTRKGIKNVAQLVAKVDLRTPQVLLETQIVEAQRSLLREFGSQFGFNYVRSPATGNATGYNFPNSVNVGGATGASGNASSFPAAISDIAGSAVDFVLESADGTKSLNATLSALENEGRIRVVSRPSVATTNNKGAIIKSVEKIRVRTPDGGTSIGVGQGASPSSSSSTATEVIELGITLEVTPQASPDYFVLMDIKAKSSTFGSREVDGIPSEVERSANSTILVSSGQTFAMGGIYKISDNDRVTGVPFLKDIPFIGHLFRRAGVDNADEELLFFITPRIIEGSFDDAAMKAAS